MCYTIRVNCKKPRRTFIVDAQYIPKPVYRHFAEITFVNRYNIVWCTFQPFKLPVQIAPFSKCYI